MALVFPTAAQAALQTPLNTFSPASTPLINTSNTNVYLYDTGLGVWTAGGAGGGLLAASLAQAAAGTVDTVANTPKTSVPKDAAGMTGAAILSSGTAAQRPATPVTGMTRVNTTNKTLEFYDGTQWQAVTSNFVADGGGWFGHSVHP